MANILVIDDDASIRSVYERYLTKLGHSVQSASDGVQGMERLKEYVPDLVITDIMMPEADGLEVIMAIRRLEANVAVIAISGGVHSMPMDFLPVAKALGAFRILYKPVGLDELSQAVTEALS
ncbi:MAG: response regulator [Pontiellaceae bacterium]|nr:response regulator [Pontiellaceae bacterium]MBN2784046.1 response regulator [Pontiellaceae bacterium]